MTLMFLRSDSEPRELFMYSMPSVLIYGVEIG